MSQKKVYLSGPMTGIEDHNKPAFDERAKAWRDEGWFVYNPAEEPEGYTLKTRPDYLRNDIRMILGSDAVAVLPGHEKSSGSCVECHVAESIEIPILDAHTFKPYVRQDRSILLVADDVINGPRNDAYGPPRVNHERIARFWSDYKGIAFSWEDVVVMMILLKCARLMQSIDHKDSWIDIAGYAALTDKQRRADEKFAAGMTDESVERAIVG